MRKDIIIKDTHRGLWYEDGAGNLQEIMNRVLAAERQSEAQLVEARTKSEVQLLDAQSKAQARILEAETQRNAERLAAQTQSEIEQLTTTAELASLRQRQESAQAYTDHPALLRLAELETLRALAQSSPLD